MLDVKGDGLLFVSSLKDFLQSLDVYGEIRSLAVCNSNWFIESLEEELKQREGEGTLHHPAGFRDPVQLTDLH